MVTISRASSRHRTFKFAIITVVAITLIFILWNFTSVQSPIVLTEVSSSTKQVIRKKYEKGKIDVPEQVFSSTLLTHKSNSSYPLWQLQLDSATEAYERGFWTQMDPVPLERWAAIDNKTCCSPTNVTIFSEWKKRVPYVIMIGAQKGGTTALSYYLYNHPSIQYFPSKELSYFDEELDRNPSLIVNGSGIQGSKVLKYYQDTIIGGIVPLLTFESQTKYGLDATPNYLFLSDRVPQRLLCTTPWVKLLAVLRDPVDRAFSQYHMQFHRDLSHPEIRRGFVSFEEYISLDMKVLQDLQLLPKGYGGWFDNESEGTVHLDPTTIFSDDFQKKWSIYTKLGLNSPVGRGLYAIQLHQWFQAMDSFQKPRSDLMVISSERLSKHPNETYVEIIDFLELSPHSLTKYGRIHETKYRTREMDATIRSKLRAFYKPFNKLLQDMLSSSDWVSSWNTVI